MGRRVMRMLIGIALVVALGIGLAPSVAPASAAVSGVTVTPGPAGTGILRSLSGPCLDVLVVGVRGSGELASQQDRFGAVVGPAVRAYRRALSDRRVGEYALNLWSPPVGVIATRSVRSYLQTIATGSDRLTSLLTARARMCPREHYVLAGYSQGAAMAHRAYWRLRGAVSDARWDGLLLIGDPDRFPGQTPHNRGTAGTTGKGIAWFGTGTNATSRPRSSAFPSGVAARAIEICDRRDIVCDITRGTRFALRHGIAVAEGDRVAEGARIHRTHYLATGRAGAGIARAAQALAAHTMKRPAGAAMTVAAPDVQLTLGHPFTARLTARGGVAPYVFTSSQVPAGLVLSQSGAVWGWLDGTRTFPLSVRDARGQVVRVSVSIGGTAGAPPVTWAQVSNGLQHTCAVRTDGQLWCWGTDVAGETGRVGASYSVLYPPAQVGSDSDWAMVSSGFTHTCAIKTDQSLWCWGSNYFGEAGRIDAQGSTSSPLPAEVTAAPAWLSVATGEYYTCGVRADHSLWCWGLNDNGQLGTSTATDRSDPVQVGTDTSWSGVAADLATTCGAKTDGSVWCWGDDRYGNAGLAPGGSTPWEPNQVTPTASWSTVAAGWFTSCGVRDDGSLWCWGSDADGQLGPGATVGISSPDPIRVGAASGWTWVAPGEAHTCAGRQDGSLWCWGSDEYGETGQPVGSDPTAAHPVPAQVGPGVVWRSASTTGSAGTCAIDDRGGLWCWGWNRHGELGVTANAGTDVPNPDPQPVG